MKRIFKFLLPLIVVGGIVFGFSFSERKADKDRLLLEIVQLILQRFHYDPSDLDNDFSLRFYNDYLENIDLNKRYLLQSDIDDFEPFNTLIDDQIKMGDLTFFDLSYLRLSTRLSNIGAIQQEILSKPFDFNKTEYFITDPDKIEYAKDMDELKDRWRKYIKYNVLIKIQDELELDKDKAKNDSLFTPRTFEQIEEEARKSTAEIFKDYNNRILELKKSDWYSVYLNVLTAQFDPHTSYFDPRDKEKFDEDMAGQLEGIGARLMSKSGYVTVSEIISGSPSWKQGDLEVEDKIVKVAQGNEAPVNIVGMRLDDAVELIKGKKGTKVRLFVKKLDGSQKEISIIRDVVEIEETFAKSAIIKKGEKRYGIIHLPKFYIDFDNRKGRNAASDVKKEIEALNKEGVDGLILDLRNNGGGSLQTAVDMTGYFIPSGPVVQVKARDSQPQILSDKDPDVLFEKPLVVLVNEYSASASEIVAAALRDYNRAVIIGSAHTFGKGTVQNVWDLDKIVNPDYNVNSLGSIKLTIQKFYRISGGATQLKGVDSDVVLPDRLSYMKVGEKEMENAMPWDTIHKLDYQKWTSNIKYDYLSDKSKSRMASSEEFLLIDEHAKWLEMRNQKDTIALGINDFKLELGEYQKSLDKFKKMYSYKNNLNFSSTKDELKLLKDNIDLKEKRERWHKNLQKDIYVDEAVNVLQDMI